MSTIENLKKMEKIGVREFVKNEKIRWMCPSCRGIICVHQGRCYNCGKAFYPNNNKVLRRR
jgi:hypothetical protein